MSKFLLNLLVQISKALVYSKINFYLEKNSPRHFRPTWPFGPIFFFFYRPIFLPSLTGPRPSGRPSPPHGPRPAQPTARPPDRPSPPHAFFLLPHRRRARMVPPPAGLAPPPRSPRRSHRKRRTATSISPSFPPINRRHSPPLQSWKPAPSTPPLKLLQAGH
jgi:hypothetical protein